jgi:hypothetical protein
MLLSNTDASFVMLNDLKNIQGECTQRIHRTMKMRNDSQRLSVQWFLTGSPAAFSFDGVVGPEGVIALSLLSALAIEMIFSSLLM